MKKPYRLELEIDELPPTTNEIYSMRLQERMRTKTYWKTLVGFSAKSKRPPAPLAKARLTLTRFSATQPDPDGLVGSFKLVVDALVLAGVLENDRWGNIGMPDYRWEHAPRGRGRIRVVVEEVLSTEVVEEIDPRQMDLERDFLGKNTGRRAGREW